MALGWVRAGLGLLAAMAFLSPAEAQSGRVHGTVETVTADGLAVRDAQVKPGTPVVVVTMAGADGARVARFVVVGINGATPLT